MWSFGSIESWYPGDRKEGGGGGGGFKFYSVGFEQKNGLLEWESLIRSFTDVDFSSSSFFLSCFSFVRVCMCVCIDPNF